MARAEALLALAESVADGASIDWAAAEEQTPGGDRDLVRQLRVIAELATLHRTLPADPAALPSAFAARRTAASPAIGRWAHLDLIERLGGGTFGDVYRAFDRHLEREVALKLLHADAAPEDDFQSSRILAEGRRLARVQHPNIVTVFGAAMHDGRVGLWMELVKGSTLEERLAASGPMSAGEAAVVGVDLCRALAALHGAELLHRDIKTQNVMREEGGRIVLMDFGTSRAVDPDRPHPFPDLAGTPLYLAPEIFDGGAASPRTDIYSLGVLLYRLVTGAFPVPAATLDELREAHAQGRVVRLRDARPDLPSAFVRVVERAIAADPAKRYATAGELEADLVAALDPLGVAAGAGSTSGRGGGRSFKWAAILAVLAAVITGIVASPGIPIPFRPPVSVNKASIGSLAVLPLVNLSGDPGQEYFADGMTEALIDSLAKLHPLRVISRTSVMRFKGTKQSVHEVASALNVDAVLEGSVIRVGNRVRISADLVHVRSDSHVWVDSYDREIRDLLDLQAEVARAVARQIQLQLTPQLQASFVQGRSVNVGVEDAYLQGRYFWNKRTSDGYVKALDYFRQATALDPTFARAYAGQADAYNLLVGGLSPSIAYPLAKENANRALALEPSLAEAHASLGFAVFIHDRNWTEAERLFTRAIQLNPNYATAHHWYGELLAASGRLDDAADRLRQAALLDPLSPSIRGSLADTFYFRRDYDEAIRRLRESLETGDGDPSAYVDLTLSHALKGSFGEAAAALDEWRARVGPRPYHPVFAALIDAMRGDSASARAILQDLSRSGTASDVFADMMAYPYIYLGDHDRAFELLARAERAGAPGLLWARVNPILDPLREDPRFARLLGQLSIAP